MQANGGSWRAKSVLTCQANAEPRGSMLCLIPGRMRPATPGGIGRRFLGCHRARMSSWRPSWLSSWASVFPCCADSCHPPKSPPSEVIAGGISVVGFTIDLCAAAIIRPLTLYYKRRYLSSLPSPPRSSSRASPSSLISSPAVSTSATNSRPSGVSSSSSSSRSYLRTESLM